ncbi:hypothetical protein RHMOL_Rhmol05G0133200 [Rhododendron molle]|uniref:Uncharacterized protein n=1 Tax=Rhododendron molle TaxID=49168 RepID=A0ACC0NNF2_RHOML|nr:hypothetical protein RHMOL_Rhmol05G0133200 [Rhododendron molle]
MWVCSSRWLWLPRLSLMSCIQLPEGACKWQLIHGTKEGEIKPLGVSTEGRDLWVSDLIDPVTRQWKVEVVQSVLQAEDASVVRAIPLPCSDVKDRWVWHHTTNGIYSVRSGYESALAIQKFIAARSVNLRVVRPSALCAEALACRGALFFALELGMESIVVERDFLQIMQNGRKVQTMESIVVEGDSLQIVQMAGKERQCNT